MSNLSQRLTALEAAHGAQKARRVMELSDAELEQTVVAAVRAVLQGHALPDSLEAALRRIDAGTKTDADGPMLDRICEGLCKAPQLPPEELLRTLIETESLS